MLIKDVLSEESSGSQPNLTPNQIIDFACTDEDSSAIWTEVKPDMSGASHTFWVSMDDDYPFIIIDPLAGDHFLPSQRCLAFSYDEPTRFDDVDTWLRKSSIAWETIEW